MAIINWNNSFHVNIEEIDRQHQKLVGIINRLADAMAEGTGKAVLGPIINELVDYTVKHFRAEERIFKLVDFPAAKAHIVEHNEFVKKISKFKEDFTSGRMGLTVELMNYLCDWLRDHIKKSDKKLGIFLDENGMRFS